MISYGSDLNIEDNFLVPDVPQYRENIPNSTSHNAQTKVHL